MTAAHRFPPSPLLILAFSLSLGACSLIPPAALPTFETPAEFKEARIPLTLPADDSPWQLADPAQPAQSLPWALFDLPELPELLSRLESGNANLAAAQARYRQAEALIDQAGAGLFPTLSANAGRTRARSSSTSGGSNTISTNNTLGLASSWEIDLWGRVQAGVEAKAASAQASAADLAGVRLAQQAQLVSALLSLRVLDVQRELLDATVADYARYVDLTRERVRFGVAGQADLAQAESQLHSVRAQAIDTGVRKATLEHAIAVLVGELPSTFQRPAPSTVSATWRAPLRSEAELANPGKLPDAAMQTHADIFAHVPSVPQVPLATPSTLLQRRPDIAAAERRAASANADVGAARAAFFPVLSLSASGGQRAASWGDILTAPARVWSIGPALAAPIFDAGLRQSQKAQAVALWEQATATYRQTVLTAFQEVEDLLATQRILSEEAAVQADAVKAARQSAELNFAQYRAGTVNSLQVITSNAALLSAERTALDLHARRLLAALDFMKAIGGTWELAGMSRR